MPKAKPHFLTLPGVVRAVEALQSAGCKCVWWIDLPKAKHYGIGRIEHWISPGGAFIVVHYWRDGSGADFHTNAHTPMEWGKIEQWLATHTRKDG